MPSQFKISRTLAEHLFQKMNARLEKRGIVGEILLFGGAAMVLAWNAREATKDIGSAFEPPSVIKELALDISREEEIPSLWLNDWAKQFTGRGHRRKDLVLAFSNLKIYCPEPEYILAMKCIASRTDESSHDIEDIRFLMAKLKLSSMENVMGILRRYFSEDAIPCRARLIIRGIVQKHVRRR